MLERDFATAEKWLADFPSDKFPGASPKSFYQAQTALARGDVELARTLFEKVRPALESNVRDHPAAARHHAALGILYGYMGRKEDAIRESRRAVELCPESTDAVEGVQRACELALVYALTGEVDQALPLLNASCGPRVRPRDPAFMTGASRRPNCVCAGNGTSSEATPDSRKCSTDRSRRRSTRAIL